MFLPRAKLEGHEEAEDFRKRSRGGLSNASIRLVKSVRIGGKGKRLELSAREPARRGMKIDLGELLSGLGPTVRRPGRGLSLGERSRAGRFWTMGCEPGLVSLAAPATCPGCAASTYRSLSFARWFSRSNQR